MKKKYYDGFNVIDILFKNLEPKKMLEVLTAFAETKGVDAVEVIRCKDCKYSDTFSDMTAEPHSQLKCLGIRYGGVEPMWYCEHGERKEE